MGARREDRDREGEMHAGVTWGNWITMQRRERGNKREGDCEEESTLNNLSLRIASFPTAFHFVRKKHNSV